MSGAVNAVVAVNEKKAIKKNVIAARARTLIFVILVAWFVGCVVDYEYE
jgi:hypothetical protein